VGSGSAALRQRRSLEKIADYHNDVVASLKAFFSETAATASDRFLGYSPRQMEEELAARVDETDIRSALTVLTSLEASFRIDYEFRCEKRMKDSLSRAFRAIQKSRGQNIRLDQDIFESWTKYATGSRQLIGDLRGAFRYRNWLAHGHYREPKLGRKYDFNYVYGLADEVLRVFPFCKLK